MTLNEIRTNGYWIMNASKIEAKLIKDSIIYRRMRRPLEEQRMADLPGERVEPSPLFSCTEIDCFSPFYRKHGQRESWRYILLCTCLSSRATHLEILNLTNDAFLNALRCFIVVKGAVRQIRSDQGTKFVGGQNHLQESVTELDENRVARLLVEKQCDFIINIPEASHMGGVWERQIRTVRSVMSTVLASVAERVDDAML